MKPIIKTILIALFTLVYVHFANSQTITDSDGNEYQIVEIGEQTWMAENLKSIHFADGTEIESVWAFQENEEYVEDYGRLYSWDAAMKGAESSESVPSGIQGVCPDGWHLPSTGEWNILIEELGGQLEAGGKLKEYGTNHWQSPNTGATNSSGFTALPGGWRDVDGTFDVLGYTGFWWSSTSYISDWNQQRYWDVLILGHEVEDASMVGTGDKGEAYSIRCLKDGYISSTRISKETPQSIYPNPANNYIIVPDMKNKDVEVFILSTEGKIVKRDLLRNQPYRIDVDKLKSGIYFIELVREGKKSQHKFVKL